MDLGSFLPSISSTSSLFRFHKLAHQSSYKPDHFCIYDHLKRNEEEFKIICNRDNEWYIRNCQLVLSWFDSSFVRIRFFESSFQSRIQGNSVSSFQIVLAIEHKLFSVSPNALMSGLDEDENQLRSRTQCQCSLLCGQLRAWKKLISMANESTLKSSLVIPNLNPLWVIWSGLVPIDKIEIFNVWNSHMIEEAPQIWGSH